MSETLFPGYEPEVREPLSVDRRRTLRQAEAIAAGRHPLTGGPLHSLASTARDAASPKDDPFTCGSCRWRKVVGYHDYRYPKCLFPGSMSAEQYETQVPPRVSHSASSDVRAWWPACRDYSPGEPKLSPDAARHIPPSPASPAQPNAETEEPDHA